MTRPRQAPSDPLRGPPPPRVGEELGAADLFQRIFPILDSRLAVDGDAPVCVGVSGGGDSVALLGLVVRWAAERRRVLALTVDHGLQPESAAWSAEVERLAARLGAGARTLRWAGEKPATGLPAAARGARHALLAAATRAAGGCVLLLGHTADDLAEAATMRAAGGAVGDPRGWAPSPAWPEGRGVMLLRPLLGVRREALRGWLRAEGIGWVEDPANGDVRFARARVRAVVGVARADGDEGRRAEVPGLRDLIDDAGVEAAGGLRLRLGAAPASLAAACACVAGRAQGVTAAAAARALAALARRSATTLGGARIVRDGDSLLLAREPGRGGLPELALGADGVVWDGRFEVRAGQGPPPFTGEGDHAQHGGGGARPSRPAPPSAAPPPSRRRAAAAPPPPQAGEELRATHIAALSGLAARLPREERAALRQVDPLLRGVLPVVRVGDGVTCPILAAGAVRVAALARARYLAAAGMFGDEATLRAWRVHPSPPILGGESFRKPE